MLCLLFCSFFCWCEIALNLSTSFFLLLFITVTLALHNLFFQWVQLLLFSFAATACRGSSSNLCFVVSSEFYSLWVFIFKLLLYYFFPIFVIGTLYTALTCSKADQYTSFSFLMFPFHFFLLWRRGNRGVTNLCVRGRESSLALRISGIHLLCAPTRPFLPSVSLSPPPPFSISPSFLFSSLLDSLRSSVISDTKKVFLVSSSFLWALSQVLVFFVSLFPFLTHPPAPTDQNLFERSTEGGELRSSFYFFVFLTLLCISALHSIIFSLLYFPLFLY